MEYRISITLVWLLVFSFHSSYGCEMGPVGSLWLPRTYSINDTFLGDIFTDETRSIASINSIVVTTSLNGGPYFGASLVDSQFTFFTVDSNFKNYEEYETETILNFNLNFNCVGGTTRAMTITINIQDTNNNDPEFIPDDEFKFTVIPPLPPGFLITNCFGEITVRDIDLTTQRIDFDIIDSSLFEIEYDAESSTVPKEFKASIRTTALIRNIPEPIVFTISATDVDLTGDQPRTTYATVTIISDGEFELPEEPVFTQTFYLATYTEDHQITLQETISLQQGYTEDVQFSLDQGSTQNFAIERNGSAISLVVATPLSAEVFAQRQILLVIIAELENTSGASATIVVELPEEEELKFEQSTYEGAIVDNVLDVPQLVLSQGYGNDPVSVEILSDHAGFFASTLQQNTITLTMSPLDEDIIEENSFLNLQVLASTNRTSASTVVTLEIVKNDTVTPVFERAVYEGEYDSMDGLTLEPIILVQGYDATVEVTLQGEHASYFQLVQEGPSISLTVSSLPSDLFREQNLLLYLSATKPRTVGATTAISIMLPPEPQLQFEQQYYRGVIEDNVLRLPSLILTDGYDNEDVSVTILSSNGINEYFTATIQENSITVTMSPLDEEIIEQNTFLNLEIVAATNRSSASTIVTLEIIKEDTVTPVFQRAIYAGAYEALDGLTLDEIELVQGYDESVLFSLQGEHSGYFEIVRVGPRINLTASSLPTELFREQNLLLSIEATKPRTVGASAAISIALPAEIQLEFEDPSYTGVIKDNILQLSELKLSQGYDTEPVSVNIDSDYASYFTTVIDQNIITLSMSPLESNIIEENTFMNLQVIASTNRSSAMTIVTLEIVKNDTLTPVFERPLYGGVYDLSEGLVLEEIVLVQGYDDTVEVFLRGEHASFFQLVQAGPSINLTTSGLPDNLLSENNLLLYIEVTKPRTVGANTAVSISMPEGNPDSSVTFDKVLYEGIVQGSVVQHEEITVQGYSGTSVTIIGAYASLFEATLSGGSVVVTASGSLTLPSDIQIIVLELRVGDIGAVLILEVTATEEQPLPTVTFESTSYVLRVEIGQAGLVGRVLATSDNGEPVSYSLQVDNEHLRSRVSVSSDGELWLSAPAASGVYSFQVIATTEFTQAVGHATVHLSVESVTVCGDDIVVAPLIVIDRDEEVEHRNLVVMNSTEHESCHYTLTNRWPVDQDWLYVDESGLHTHAIDREHPSIAFMALSQIQVELNLVCGGDVTRTKRSLDGRLDWLGPYDYGTNTWVLTDTILYNSRRSIVNLIVNDINDNTPIFDGKENEPIVVGYPVLDLEETILPRSLAELQATDADVGENARLRYWSEDPEIVVSPTTGFVHVRSGAQLEENMMLMVNATDRNGEGLTGSISLKVKLLETEHIAVITARDAFLEDERIILGNLSNAIGYDVRALRSVVTSISEEQQATRKKRDTAATSGVALVIYVYGLLQSEPVSVETLSNDINSATIVTVDIASILSLEDHLEGNEICVITGRDTGLLAATIVLSVLLFLLIVAAVVFYFLVWRKKQNYDQFSDASSIVSQGESPGQPSKPDVVAKPRLNIEELKRSERRLQDMLNAPIEEVTVEPIPTSSKMDTTNPTAKPLPEPLAPIVVIQDKLKDAAEESDEDEFGEIKRPRRKSVVTFNENVEKIIHVDDSDEPDIIANPNYEVYKL